VAIDPSGREGLGDLLDVLATLPMSLRAVVMVVLHGPWDMPYHLRRVLAQRSPLPIVVATNSQQIGGTTPRRRWSAINPIECITP
jgi:hypothetical protein